MKTHFICFLLIFLTGNISFSFEEKLKCEKDSNITVIYDSTILNKDNTSQSRLSFSKEEIAALIHGDTFVYVYPQKIIYTNKFPWSVIDHIEEKSDKSYINSNRTKIVKKNITKVYFERSGENLPLPFSRIFLCGLGVIGLTFLFSLFNSQSQIRQSKKYLLNQERFIDTVGVSSMGIMLCGLASWISMGTETGVSRKLLFLIAGVYWITLFIAYRLGKIYLKRLLRKKELSLQKT